MNNKEILLHEAATMMAHHGYHNLAMDDLLQSTGIAKSNAYYHFPTKENLGLEVLKYWVGIFDRLNNNTINSSLPVVDRLNHYFGRLIKFQQASDYPGDPITNLSNEIANDESQKIYSQYQDNVLTIWASLIKESNKNSRLNINNRSAAYLTLMSVNSALTHVKILQSIKPLNIAATQIKSLLNINNPK